MGIGDDLMCAGEARKLRERDPRNRPCQVHKKPGRVMWRQVWEVCPDIVRREVCPAQAMMEYGPGKRGYIDYLRSTPTRWVWKPYRPTPARIELREPPIRTGKILIEPNIKPSAPPHKQWGWKRWQEVVNRFPGQFIQVGAPGSRVLRGVEFCPTGNIFEAMRYLAGARAAVLPEGGLHHAAAALGTPAVVLFGGYITPSSTGYDFQRNLWVDCPEAQGWRIAKPICTQAWESITPQMVIDTLGKLIDEGIPGNIPAGHRGTSLRTHPPEPQEIRGTP